MQTNERKQLLEDALDRVTFCDDKRGAPEDSFKVIAALWSAYLGHEVEPHDVAALMALLKVARIKTSPGDRDSWLDLAGYAACGSACALNKERPTLIVTDRPDGLLRPECLRGFDDTEQKDEGRTPYLVGKPEGVLIRKGGDPLNPFDRVE